MFKLFLFIFWLIVVLFICVDVSTATLEVYGSQTLTDARIQADVWNQHCKQPVPPLIANDPRRKQLCAAHTRWIWQMDTFGSISEYLLIFMHTSCGLFYLSLTNHDPFVGSSLDTKDYWRNVHGYNIDSSSFTWTLQRIVTLILDEYLRYSTLLVFLFISLFLFFLCSSPRLPTPPSCCRRRQSPLPIKDTPVYYMPPKPPPGWTSSLYPPPAHSFDGAKMLTTPHLHQTQLHRRYKVYTHSSL